MSIHRKLTTVCCAAVLALGLAACGSSSDDDNQADMNGNGDGMEMPAPPTAAEQLAAAQTAVSDAEDAVAAATTAAERASAYSQLAAAEQTLAEAEVIPENVLTALRQRLAEAEGDLDEAETAAMNLRDAVDAINAAQTAAGALDADSDQTAVDAASALVTAAHNAVNALDADDQARLSSQVSSANYMVMAAQTRLDNAVTVAANTKSAGTKAKAIGDEAAQTTDDGAGGEGATDDHTVAVSSDKVEITVVGAAMDDPKFEDQNAGLDAGRTMLVRTMDANDDGEVVQEVMIVGTDIAAPRDVAFAKWEDAAGAAPHMLTVRQDGETATDEMPNDSISVAEGADDVNLPLIKSATFAVPPVGSSSATHTFLPAAADADPDTMGAQPRDAAMVDGSYRGADGTYTCSGTDECTVTVDDEGDVTAIAGMWIFTPGTDATSSQPDYEYLSYGFWLKKTADADDATTYNEVETFATATGVVPTADGLDDVTGSATYDGDAVGVYVKNVLDDQANIVSATSGHFKADVELTATFGGGNVAANSQFTIGGTLDNFDLQHGEQNDWAVSLGLADFSGGRQNDGEPGKSLPGNSHTNAFNGTATGDSTAAAGSWNGIFHGVAGQINHDDDTDTPDINTAPSAVIGEFNANFTDGTAAGGYGANKK